MNADRSDSPGPAGAAPPGPVRELAERGFAVLPGLLGPEQVSVLNVAAGRFWRQRGAARQGYLQAFDLFALDEAFMVVLDVSPVLEAVRTALGENVSVYHSHLTGTGHNVEDPRQFRYRWHQDAKAVVADLGRAGRPPCVSVKAGFFLTDVPRADHGATVFLPGTHLRDPGAGLPDPFPVVGPAGTCVLFDNRTWHSRGPNVSSRIRFCAYVAYGYRWLQNRDSWHGAGCVLDAATLTARQRFLLGHADSPRERHSAQP